ncbi:MAG: BrnT family toxin [Janthinobacterium lividum]
MQVSFCPIKDAINSNKHGVPLSFARNMDESKMFSYPDRRKDYREERWIGLAPIGKRLFCAVFTLRSDIRHVISLRKANPREIKRYEQNQPFHNAHS